MAVELAILAGNDNSIVLSGARNPITGAPLNAATVTVTLRNLDGTDVGGQVWPLALAFTGTDGEYRGNLGEQLQLDPAANPIIEAHVLLNAGAELVGRWEKKVAVLWRR